MLTLVKARSILTNIINSLDVIRECLTSKKDIGYSITVLKSIVVDLNKLITNLQTKSK